MFAIIMSLIGILVWLVGIVFAVVILFDEVEDIRDRISLSMFALMFLGLMGFGFNIPGFIIPIKNIVTIYEVPTAIVKSDGVTVVAHVSNKKCVINNFSSTDTSYWNSTNIMIKIVSGNNFWGKEISNYEVVIKDKNE
jgi:hypothetical protein